MNTRVRKASVLGLSACLALSSLAGCSKKEKEFDTAAAAVTVNGDEIPAGVVSFAVHYTQVMTEYFYSAYMGISDPFNTDLYGNGSTLGDMMKEEAVDDLTEMVLAEQKMGEYSVELTEEEKSSITAAATAFMEANEEEVLKEIGATQEAVERYLELMTIQHKMEPAMSADVDTEVSDEEAAQRRIQYTMFTPSTEAETEEETEADTETASQAGAEEESGAEEETAPETEGETAPATEAETAALAEEESVKTQAAAETEAVSEEGTEAAAASSEDTEAAGGSGSGEPDAETTGDMETEAPAEEAAAEAAETEEEAVSEGTEAASGDAEADTEEAREEETETETEDPAMVEAKAKAKAEAQAMLDNIKGGMSFEDAAEAAGKSANEMTFGVGDEDTRAELLAATDGLADDTLVEDVVETDNGYYVVKLVNQLDREATDEEKESIIEDRKSDRIEELYTEWKDGAEISQDDEVLATITFGFSLEQYVETETEETEESEDGTEAGDAETEDGTEAGDAETEAVTEAETEAGTEAVTEAETEAGTEAVTEAE